MVFYGQINRAVLAHFLEGSMEIKIGMAIKGRGKIAAVGDGIPKEMNAPTWTPVRFEDGTYAVLGSWYMPLEFEAAGEPDYNACIRNAAGMPRVGSMGTGWNYIDLDLADDSGLTIRVGTGFGKEDRIEHKLREKEES